MKYKQPRPGIDIEFPCPFRTTVAISLEGKNNTKKEGIIDRQNKKLWKIGKVAGANRRFDTL